METAVIESTGSVGCSERMATSADEINEWKEEQVIIVQCCVCGKTRLNGRWTKIEKSLRAPVSHTYCPKCCELQFRELRFGIALRERS
ncbi:hypothetical protein ACFL1X_10920 [Candidatus Hydrogenedentota bacterium]